MVNVIGSLQGFVLLPLPQESPGHRPHLGRADTCVITAPVTEYLWKDNSTSAGRAGRAILLGQIKTDSWTYLLEQMNGNGNLSNTQFCLTGRSRVKGKRRKKLHYELLKEMNVYVFGQTGTSGGRKESLLKNFKIFLSFLFSFLAIFILIFLHIITSYLEIGYNNSQQ